MSDIQKDIVVIFLKLEIVLSAASAICGIVYGAKNGGIHEAVFFGLFWSMLAPIFGFIVSSIFFGLIWVFFGWSVLL